MFGNLLKSLKTPPIPVKTVASNSFLNAINKAKQEIAESKPTNNVGDKYSIVFEEGLSLLFEATDDIGTDYGLYVLKEAAKKFAEAISIRKSKPEPYFYLSHIFFILNETSLAIKYFKVVEFINPNFYGLKELKKNIDEIMSIPKKINIKLPDTINTTQQIIKPKVLTRVERLKK